MSSRSSRSNRKAVVPLPLPLVQQPPSHSSSSPSHSPIESSSTDSMGIVLPLADSGDASGDVTASSDAREAETRQMLSLSVLSSLNPSLHLPTNPTLLASLGLTTPSAHSQPAMSSSSALSGSTSGSSLNITLNTSSGVKCRGCNCRNSKCLKLYCECFASGVYCDGCNCKQCHNNLEHDKERKQAIEATLERNPRAFKPKIAVTAATPSPKHATLSHSGSGNGNENSNTSNMAIPSPSNALLTQSQFPPVLDDLSLRAIHHRGCHCKKSFCLKKYCECYQAGIVCSENCRCQDCKNFNDSVERQSLEARQTHLKRGLTPTNMAANVNAAAFLPLTINGNGELSSMPLQSPSPSHSHKSSTLTLPNLSSPMIHSDFVVDLSRSLLLAAHNNRTGSTSATSSKRHVSKSGLKLEVGELADSEQAVKDLLMLASPANVNAAPAGAISTAVASQTPKRKRESGSFTFAHLPSSASVSTSSTEGSSSSSSLSHLVTGGASLSERSLKMARVAVAVEGGSASADWRLQIKANALASVHRAMQQAAQNPHQPAGVASTAELDAEPVSPPLTTAVAMRCTDEELAIDSSPNSVARSALTPATASDHVSASANSSPSLLPSSLDSPSAAAAATAVAATTSAATHTHVHTHSVTLAHAHTADSAILDEFGSYLRRLQSYAQRDEHTATGNGPLVAVTATGPQPTPLPHSHTHSHATPALTQPIFT